VLAQTSDSPSSNSRRSRSARVGAVIAWVRDLNDSMTRSRILGLAAETAFWVALSLVPLAAVMGLVAARLTTNNWAQLAPVISGLPEPARGFVRTELVRVSKWNGGAVGVTAAAVFVWLGSSGVQAIISALEIETGERRPWWRKRLLALGTCIALSFVIGALALLGPSLREALRVLAEWIPALSALRRPPTLVEKVVRAATSVALSFGYVCALYWVATPPRARKTLPIVPGACVAVVLQRVFGFGYAEYISRTGTGDAYKAGLAIVGLTLISLYLFAVALLVGALVNRRIGRPIIPCSDSGSGPSTTPAVSQR